jgi:simple sugar transport system ATP-binding protein
MIPARADKTSPAPVVLSLCGISKRFGSLLANDEISLTLRAGEVLALLGENGAGKTTLMNILFGHYLADQGQIEVFSHALPAGSPRAAIAMGIGMVHQRLTLADNLSVLDNILLGTEPLCRPWQDRRKARRRLADLSQTFGLRVDPEARVGQLSVGERQRVEILKALYREARILILDEPTAVLTPQETTHLFATLHKMTQQGLAIIFISHKLPEVMQVSERIVVLRSGRVVAEVKTADTSPTQLAEWMVGQRIPATIRPPLPSGDPVLQLQEVTVAGSHAVPLIHRLSLTLHQHEIVGIAGVAGNGQSALADLISGLLKPSYGSLQLYGNPVLRYSPAAMIEQGMARIPEDRHKMGLIADLPIWENLIAEQYRERTFSRAGFLKRGTALQHAAQLVQDYTIRSPVTSGDPLRATQVPVRLLSGGNMQKLILARGLSRLPRIILANQPTRGLDLGAVAYVHQQLLKARAQGAGILLISEDLEELLSLSDRIHVLFKGQLSVGIPAEQVTIREVGLRMAGETGKEMPHAV